MVGSRPHISTQDLNLRLSEEAINPIHNKRTKTILALDLTKAFESVNHEAVTETFSNLGVGERAHISVRAFLSASTTEIRFGSLKSNTFIQRSRTSKRNRGKRRRDRGATADGSSSLRKSQNDRIIVLPEEIGTLRNVIQSTRPNKNLSPGRNIRGRHPVYRDRNDPYTKYTATKQRKKQ